MIKALIIMTGVYAFNNYYFLQSPSQLLRIHRLRYEVNKFIRSRCCSGGHKRFISSLTRKSSIVHILILAHYVLYYFHSHNTYLKILITRLYGFHGFTVFNQRFLRSVRFLIKSPLMLAHGTNFHVPSTTAIASS